MALSKKDFRDKLHKDFEKHKRSKRITIKKRGKGYAVNVGGRPVAFSINKANAIRRSDEIRLKQGKVPLTSEARKKYYSRK